mgnify:CR=1 FL=1
MIMNKEKENPPKKVVQNPQVEFDARLFENEVWLTTEEVMTHLNVSRSTMYRLRKKHNIPSCKLGKMPMYPKHLLNKLFIHKALGNVKKNEM